MDRELTITLSAHDLELLVEALDSHEYWQLGYNLPRKNGFVILPGDRDPDLIWEASPPTANEHESIVEIERCRTLSARLEAMVRGTT